MVSVVNDDPAAIANFALRLTGEVPPRARRFTWASSLVFGSYALLVRHATDGHASAAFAMGTDANDAAGRDARTEWLEDRRESTPVDLADLKSFESTIAHSITLGLTMYGLVSLSPAIVEPLIALSIAYVAIENLFARQLTPWRLALVFSFGLLHGMGFAGVLAELGLPRSQFLTALVSFNLGVETGQLAVIAIASAIVAYWRRDALTYRRWIVLPASACIALVGLYWTIARIAV